MPVNLHAMYMYNTKQLCTVVYRQQRILYEQILLCEIIHIYAHVIVLLMYILSILYQTEL